MARVIELRTDRVDNLKTALGAEIERKRALLADEDVQAVEFQVRFTRAGAVFRILTRTESRRDLR